MLTIIFNIILIIVGYLFVDLIGYLGTLLLIIDINNRYFDSSDIKIFLFFILMVSISGYLWDRSLFAIIMMNIFFFSIFILGIFLKKKRQ